MFIQETIEFRENGPRKGKLQRGPREQNVSKCVLSCHKIFLHTRQQGRKKVPIRHVGFGIFIYVCWWKILIEDEGQKDENESKST